MGGVPVAEPGLEPSEESLSAAAVRRSEKENLGLSGCLSGCFSVTSIMLRSGGLSPPPASCQRHGGEGRSSNHLGGEKNKMNDQPCAEPPV